LLVYAGAPVFIQALKPFKTSETDLMWPNHLRQSRSGSLVCFACIKPESKSG